MSGRVCRRMPSGRCRRTASCAAARERSRPTVSGTTSPGKRTMLRTGRIISASSGSGFEPPSQRTFASFADASMRGSPSAERGWELLELDEFNSSNSHPLSAEGEPRMEASANDANVRWEGGSKPLPDDALMILPVRNMVLFPGLVVPLTVGRDRSRAAAQEAVRLQRPLGILLQTRPDIDNPKPEEMHWVGTTANVLRYVTAEGAHHAICQG